MKEAPERIMVSACGKAIVTDQPAYDDDVEYLRADLARPKVKDLIWEPTFISGEHLRHVALGGLGGLIAYEVGVKEHYVLVNGRRLGIKKLGDFESLEAAKAAAQADYEARVLSALEGYE